MEEIVALSQDTLNSECYILKGTEPPGHESSRVLTNKTQALSHTGATPVVLISSSTGGTRLSGSCTGLLWLSLIL